MSSAQGQKTFPIKLFSYSAVKRRHHFRTSALPSKMPLAPLRWGGTQLGVFFCHRRGTPAGRAVSSKPLLLRSSKACEELRWHPRPGARMLTDPRGLPGDPRPPADAPTWASNRPFFQNSTFHKTQKKATLNTAAQGQTGWEDDRPSPQSGSQASPQLPPQPRSGSMQSNPNFCTQRGAPLERAKRRAPTPAGPAAPLPRSPQNPRATWC